MARFAADRRPRDSVAEGPASLQVADPRKGTSLVIAYAAGVALLLLAWGARHGLVVELSPLELSALVGLSACAGQISILVGPRTWYQPSSPIVILAGLAGGPIAGALTGASTEALASDHVWRQRLMGASRSALEGFAAGLIGMNSLAGTGGGLVRTAAAVGTAFALGQIARVLIVRARGMRPALTVLRVGIVVDAVEAVIVLPVLAALLATRDRSPALAVCALAALLVGLGLAERAHARQASQLERERAAARTDSLTSAPNRLAFDEALAREHARVVRGARPAGLFLVDLDRFKLVNDRYGHDVGDRVLVETVDRLRQGLRPADVVARWGGEELIVLAPELGTIDALERYGERVRRLIGGDLFLTSDTTGIPVTASVGGAMLDGSTAREIVLKRADVAVYRAKERRNASVVEIPAVARRTATGLIVAERV